MEVINAMKLEKGWKQKFRISVLILVVLFLATGIAVVLASGQGDYYQLTILHTNDIHAAYEDFGKLAAYVEKQRGSGDYFLYLDAGDIFSGNPVVDLKKVSR